MTELDVEDGEQDEDGERQLALAGRGVVAPHEAQPPALNRRRGAGGVGNRTKGVRLRRLVDLGPFGGLM